LLAASLIFQDLFKNAAVARILFPMLSVFLNKAAVPIVGGAVALLQVRQKDPCGKNQTGCGTNCLKQILRIKDCHFYISERPQFELVVNLV
jgi:hypothetical protein